MTNSILYTIGYEKRSLDEFIAILKDAGVDVVIDVRDVAWSRKRGFSKSALTTALGAAGIDYIHAKFAGNPKLLRDSAGTHAEGIVKYRERLASNPGIMEQFDRLVDPLVANGKRVALVCYERHPDDCHRGVLADAWTADPGHDVVHLATESIHEVAR